MQVKLSRRDLYSTHAMVRGLVEQGVPPAAMPQAMAAFPLSPDSREQIAKAQAKRARKAERNLLAAKR